MLNPKPSTLPLQRTWTRWAHWGDEYTWHRDTAQEVTMELRRESGGEGERRASNESSERRGGIQGRWDE